VEGPGRCSWTLRDSEDENGRCGRSEGLRMVRLYDGEGLMEAYIGIKVGIDGWFRQCSSSMIARSRVMRDNRRSFLFLFLDNNELVSSD
jgi:hypothetical protein